MALQHKTHQKLLLFAETLKAQMAEQGYSNRELEELIDSLDSLFERNEELRKELKEVMEEYQQQSYIFRREYSRQVKRLKKEAFKLQNKEEVQEEPAS